VVPLPGYTIHLDLLLAMVDTNKAIIDAAGLPYWFLRKLDDLGITAIHPHPDEAWAVNALCLAPGRVLIADGSPRTAEALADAGVELVTVPYDELHKNGGGIHCSTMELIREPASSEGV
jgi:N-dimethylarginine dimethylaminohydrolase